MAQVSDTAVFGYKDSNGNLTTISGAELKANWNAMDFVVSDVNFGANKGGQVVPQGNGRVTDTFNFNTMNGWALVGADGNTVNGVNQGTTFILLHELGHAVPDGQNGTTDLYDNFINNGGNKDFYAEMQPGDQVGAPGFDRNEAYANSFARSAGAFLGQDVALYTVPPHMYIEDKS